LLSLSYVTLTSQERIILIIESDETVGPFCVDRLSTLEDYETNLS